MGDIMKKIYVLGLFLIVAVSALGIAFAASQDIGGFSFNIPDGYNEVGTNESYEEPFTVVEKYFQNSNGDTINITVETCDQGVTITSLEPGPYFNYTTVAGHDGIATKDSPTTHTPVFKFVTDDGSQQITIAATNESIIEECLKA